MSDGDPARITDLQQLVIPYGRPAERSIWRSLFALDTHLAALVRKASEPMLGQVRLAWWRDRLQEERSKWPLGNPLLASLDECWGTAAPKLAPLVDGWEHLLAEPLIPRSDIEGFANGRGEAMRAVADLLDTGNLDEAARAGTRWAVADLLVNSVNMQERALILSVADNADPAPSKLPRSMRPLAILDGLARRSLAAKGAPLFAGRRAALAALRLGMLGR